MAYYGADEELLVLVADKQAIQDAFPLDGPRGLAYREVLRSLRRQGMSDADLAAIGAEGLAQLKDAENFGTLAHFFAGFLQPELQEASKAFRKRMEDALDSLPLDDDDPNGESLFEGSMGLG